MKEIDMMVGLMVVTVLSNAIDRNNTKLYVAESTFSYYNTHR